MSADHPPLAAKPAGLTSSAIRDLLALTARPEVTSLAGGLPDTDLLPAARIAEAAGNALRGGACLQYTESPGWGPLREIVAARESHRMGRAIPVGEVFVTHGSQQALALLAEALVDPGSAVVVEDPAYVGALQAFRAVGARITALPMDSEGLRIDLLRELLAGGTRPAVVHTVSTFHNPGGVTMSSVRRRELAELAQSYGFWVIEDDPYGELWFHRPAPDPVASYSTNVIRLSSASKIIAPTLRTGWMIAPVHVCRAVELLKQGADLCGSALTQQIAAELLADTGWLAEHIDSVRKVYAERATALVTAVRTLIGDRMTCTEATGGMFVWADFTDGTDTAALLPRAVEAGVAYVPGRAFAAGGDYPHSLRMCFTSATPEALTEAIRRLSRA